MPSAVVKVTDSTNSWGDMFTGVIVGFPGIEVTDEGETVIDVTDLGSGFVLPQATRNAITATLVRFSQECENILIFIVLPAFLSAHKTTLHETKWQFKLHKKGHTPLLEDWFHHLI